jgi:hypothetical protein
MVSVDADSRAEGLTVEISHGVTLKITILEEARLAAELIKSLRPSR